LKALKEVGCNALRLAHHLYMPEMLDLCDELGFYVYEECFDKWTGGAYGRYYETEWQRDIDAMVLRDRNRPSILFWGVGNEVENQSYPSMLEILEQYVARVKELDFTRPVSLAMNPHFTYPTAREVDMSQVTDIQKFVDEAKCRAADCGRR
ncbi:MAG: glycoside hydrolase family 2 protein, partial [Lachnospiraceae bacterium]|nr:glycoside hydrolase family 2 protein [Lachnospiraceae bacterium]